MPALSKWDAGRFVAWDSEGFDVNGSHEVVLLANSSERYLERVSGLRTAQVFNWIVDGIAGKHRETDREAYSNCTHVIFAGSYDANMWLRDVPRSTLRRLWSGEPTYWSNRGASFRIQYRQRKFFMLHRYRDGKREGGIIWDVIGFFQSSFVEACKAHGLTAEIERIESMKAKRRQFRVEDMPEIRSYCLEECSYLRQLCETLRHDMEAAEIRVSRWDGAGALAAALLRKYNVAKVLAPLPPKVEQAARHAYFGGRIELVKFGHTLQRIWKYDINSAYPAATTTLPCLAHGTWYRQTQFDPDSFGVWRVTVETPVNRQQIGALPFRARTGNVYFPWHVDGWYWTPEINAALAAGCNVRIRRGYVLARACDHTPFVWLEKLYRYRQQLKYYGMAGQKTIKLGVNALYGKFAQKLGSRDGKVPRWHNLAYAGYITSYTRAKLLAAAMQAGENLVSLATDAVFSLAPLDELPVSDKLGDWDMKVAEGFTSLQSGVYWFGSERETPNARRGFDGSRLKLPDVLEAWRKDAEHITIVNPVFVTMGLALQTSMPWRQWFDADRMISLWPDGTKRTMLVSHKRAAPYRHMVQTQPTDPYTNGTELSYPVVRPWDKGEVRYVSELESDEMREALEYMV